MIEIIVQAINLTDYINGYSYYVPDLDTEGFYFKFIKEFEFAEYVIGFGVTSGPSVHNSMINKIENDIEIIDCQKSTFFDDEIFTFAFPDEETALYFKMKFCS